MICPVGQSADLRQNGDGHQHQHGKQLEPECARVPRADARQAPEQAEGQEKGGYQPDDTADGQRGCRQWICGHMSLIHDPHHPRAIVEPSHTR